MTFVLIQHFFANVDQRDWSSVSAAFADTVYVDYTALDGKAGFQTPNDIVTGWKALLPGFDQTVHQIHNEAIWVAGNRATATLDAIATHVLDQDHWTVFVGYDMEFIQQEDQWAIARIDLSLYQQIGNPDLLAKAMKNVQSSQLPQLINSKASQETVERFFKALETNNLEALVSTWAPSVYQEMPLAPSSFPKRIDGLEALKNQYAGGIDYDQRYPRQILPTADPNTVLVKFEGQITTAEGRPYHNSYVSIFTTNASGQITAIVELFNPQILLDGWPGLQSEHFSVHAAGASTASGVSLKPVQFMSNGHRLQGHLFLPADFNNQEQYPTAIVTGSWTSVKEQMPDTYASRLAERGWITLTFDFRGFGESEGMPRQVENPQMKIEDIKAAVDFLSQHQNVDQAQLKGLGICASAGYMAHATALDTRITELLLIAPWLHDPTIARSIYDMRPGGTDGLLAAAEAAKNSYAENGEMPYVLAASELDPLSAMYVPENAFDYYLNPAKAAGTAYDNRFAVSSWEGWLNFDGISAAENIQQPVRIVHSESGAIPAGTKAFFDGLNNEKTISWLNDYTQQDLYHHDDAITAALDQIKK
ncbi:MAG: nuclear transport factor 2 family protein [Bacteroidota bacterium]